MAFGITSPGIGCLATDAQASIAVDKARRWAPALRLPLETSWSVKKLVWPFASMKTAKCPRSVVMLTKIQDEELVGQFARDRPR